MTFVFKKRACKHEKTYADYVLPSLPPQYPWACKKCGEKGTDFEPQLKSGGKR